MVTASPSPYININIPITANAANPLGLTNPDTWGWDPTTAPPLPSRPLSPTPPPPEPVIPRAAGSGGTTVVNTQALTTFASNIDQLIAPVTSAQQDVRNLNPLAAGAFDRAWGITDKVTGGSATSTGTGTATPLKASFDTVLNDLISGLSALRDAANQMATTYTTTNALNGMSVSSLQQALDTPASDFSGMVGTGGG